MTDTEKSLLERAKKLLGSEVYGNCACPNCQWLRDYRAAMAAVKESLTTEAEEETVTDTQRLQVLMKPDKYGDCLQLRHGLENGYGHTWYCGLPHFTHIGSGTTPQQAIGAAIAAMKGQKETGK